MRLALGRGNAAGQQDAVGTGVELYPPAQFAAVVDRPAHNRVTEREIGPPRHRADQVTADELADRTEGHRLLQVQHLRDKFRVEVAADHGRRVGDSSCHRGHPSQLAKERRIVGGPGTLLQPWQASSAGRGQLLGDQYLEIRRVSPTRLVVLLPPARYAPVAEDLPDLGL